MCKCMTEKKEEEESIDIHNFLANQTMKQSTSDPVNRVSIKNAILNTCKPLCCITGVPDDPWLRGLDARDTGGGGGRDSAVQAILQPVDREGCSDRTGQGPQGGESGQ